jgi:hypothetical protein
MLFGTNGGGTTGGVPNNYSEHMRITGSTGFVGISTNPTSVSVLSFDPDAPLTVNANTVAAVSPQAGTLLHTVGPNASPAYITMDTYGGIPFLFARRANGSPGTSLQALNSGDFFGGFGATGHNGSGYQSGAPLFIFQATENWSPTAMGSKLLFQSTVNGTASAVTNMVLNQSGGLSVGSANVATDPGSGIVLASGLQSKVLTVATLPTCNAAAEGQRAYVSDQNTAVAYRGAVTGSGTTRQAVLCSNSAWIQD